MIQTKEDAKRYCPSNSKCRGDDQTALLEDDYDEGMCTIDGERCQYSSCSILKNIMGAP
jgi:hypothetical protein